jgi:hypothetical protein
MEVSENFPFLLFSKCWKRISPVLLDETYINYERIRTKNLVEKIQSFKPSMFMYCTLLYIPSVSLPCNTDFHYKDVLLPLSKRIEKGTLGPNQANK